MSTRLGLVALALLGLAALAESRWLALVALPLAAWALWRDRESDPDDFDARREAVRQALR